jgi:hypothetical protein
MHVHTCTAVGALEGVVINRWANAWGDVRVVLGVGFLLRIVLGVGSGVVLWFLVGVEVGSGKELWCQGKGWGRDTDRHNIAHDGAIGLKIWKQAIARASPLCWPCERSPWQHPSASPSHYLHEQHHR